MTRTVRIYRHRAPGFLSAMASLGGCLVMLVVLALAAVGMFFLAPWLLVFVTG